MPSGGRKKGRQNHRRVPIIDVEIKAYPGPSPPLRHGPPRNGPRWLREDQLAKTRSPKTDRQKWLRETLADIARALRSTTIPWAFKTHRDEHAYWLDAGAAAFLKNGGEVEFEKDEDQVIVGLILREGFWAKAADYGIARPHFGAGSPDKKASPHHSQHASTADLPPTHRNPNWSRDELILALDLYLTNRDSPPSQTSPAVKELSALLNRMAKFLVRRKGDEFRNANGVYMKMMNFRGLDPKFTIDGKKGLTRGGKAEKDVWDEFASDEERLKRFASSIKAGITELENFRPDISEYEDIEDAEEGRILTISHRIRERNRKLTEELKKKIKAECGKLECMVCRFDFERRYGSRGAGFIEAHHTKPLHTYAEGSKTRISDLALVCANCHRMIHAKRPWLSIDELRSMLQAQD